jgi:hypothetical protein
MPSIGKVSKEYACFLMENPANIQNLIKRDQTDTYSDPAEEIL